MARLRIKDARRGLLVAAVAALAVPAPSQAAKTAVTDGTLAITAAAGERNDAGIQVTNSGDLLFFDNSVKPTAGAGCKVKGGDAVCSGKDVTAVTVSLGNRSDSFSIEARTPALTYSGGTGFDSVSYAGNVDGPANVFIDGLANDGRDARDNIGADVEEINGTPEGETLMGGAARVLLYGSDGNDTLTGGSRGDRIKAAYVEDTGLDLGAFDRQGLDTISCGAGNDQVFADRDDLIADDCEVVGLPSGPERYTYRGSAGKDRIQVDEFVVATVRAGAGNDSVSFPGKGNGRIYGEGGNDTLRGSKGFDRFSGGRGKDVIRARDGDRDAISCGSGRDRVTADKKDKVARNCERVRRR